MDCAAQFGGVGLGYFHLFRDDAFAEAAGCEAAFRPTSEAAFA